MNAAAMARRRAAKRARRRYHPLVWVVAVVFVASIVITLALPRSAAAMPPSSPLALQQWGSAGPLAAGAALNRSSVTVSFLARAGTSAAVPEVEGAVAGRRFAGRASAWGRPIAAGTQVRASVVIQHLRDGVAYRWRARLHGRDGRTSRWVTFDGLSPSGDAGAFLVDLTPPPAPQLSSPTDPDPTAWYTSSLASIAWSVPRDAGDVAGYAYTLDRASNGVPAPRFMARGSGVNVLIPADGQWYIHVRAVDRAGNWGAPATYALRVDRHPAAFANVSFARTSFDPDIERENVSVTLAGPAHLRARILDQYTGALVRSIDLGAVSSQTTLRWDGRDNAGHPAPAGSYRFLLTATDAFGQQSVADYSWIGVVRRRLLVSLIQQRLVAYDGTRVVASTLVTTGNRKLPTPVGVFHILEKLHPFTFISPWPPGSPYYYTPSPVQYALMFDWNGFYIHDAPWRSVFGPGSNAKLGTPGQNLTGTHGCVNVPPAFAAWLYTWAPIGTVVQVVS